MSGASDELPLVPMGLASASTGLWRRWLSSLPPPPCWLACELHRLRMAGLDVKLLRPSIGLINIFASFSQQTGFNIYRWWCYRFELYRGLVVRSTTFPNVLRDTSATFWETQVRCLQSECVQSLLSMSHKVSQSGWKGEMFSFVPTLCVWVGWAETSEPSAVKKWDCWGGITIVVVGWCKAESEILSSCIFWAWFEFLTIPFSIACTIKENT